MTRERWRTLAGSTSGVVSNAPATVELSAELGMINYVTGFTVMAFGATAASIVQITLSGLKNFGGTLIYFLHVPAGAATPCSPFPLEVELEDPIPAAGSASAIVLTVPALGAGNTHCVANIRGYRL